jgi:hypothetical protein
MEIEASIASFAREPNGALLVLPSPVATFYRSSIGETAEIPFWPGRGRRFRAKADIESQAGSASSVALSLACDRYFVGVVVLDR